MDFLAFKEQIERHPRVKRVSLNKKMIFITYYGINSSVVNGWIMFKKDNTEKIKELLEMFNNI